jgi:FkbM family methyltransferase
MKESLWRFIVKLPFLSKPSVRYCVDHHILPGVFTKTPSAVLRELLFLPRSSQITQLNQDIFALLVNQFKPGYYIEIGANDGFTLSNTVYLEEHFGWSGLLAEANPKYADSLARRRHATIINKAIADEAGVAQFSDAGLHGGLTKWLDTLHACHTDQANRISVPCITLKQMFDDACVPTVIDFLSVDVEGGEVPIVRQLVQNERRVRCGCIEVNERENDIAVIKSLLGNANYKIVWDGLTEQDIFFADPKLLSGGL